jgi:hypothetical protein
MTMSRVKDIKSPASEAEQGQKISPRTDDVAKSTELDDRQLDDLSGGGTGTVTYVPPPPRSGPIGP